MDVMPVPSGTPQGTAPSACCEKRGFCARVRSFFIGAAVCVVFLNFFLLVGVLAGRAGGMESADEEALIQEVGTGVDAGDKIVSIPLEGVITEPADDSAGGPWSGSVGRVLKALDRAGKDDRVKAVVILANTPGGGVTASDRIYHEVKGLRAKGKKVVLHMGDLCASGGYYVAAAADRVVACPTTITGSIGVIISTYNVAELAEKLGVKAVSIKSGPNKDILSPFRPMREDEARIVQGLVMSMYDRFVKVVAEGRNLPEAEVRVIADGRIYTAQEAVDKKLADVIGYREDAYEEARKAAGVAKARVIRYAQTRGLLETVLMGEAETWSPGRAGTELSRLLDLETPRPMYLYRPGLTGR